jgi:hypothetical protein
MAVSPTKSPTPVKLASPAPEPFGANWFEEINRNGKGYQLRFDWTPITNIRGYSIEISKNGGASPPKKITTVRTELNFKNVAPGEWYINLIAQKKDRTWTDVYFWKVQVGPEPTAEPTPEPRSEEEVLSVKTKVEAMIKKATQKSKITTGEDEEEVEEKAYDCDVPVKCSKIKTCGEIYYRYYECEDVNLDLDGDGIPCNLQVKNKCGNM